MYNFKQELLKNLFKQKGGNSKLTKAYCNERKGDYEVYTGTTLGTFAKINEYEYEIPQLTYTTDGEYAGTLKVLTGKYNIGGHRAILEPQKENICLEYFAFVLQPLFFNAKRICAVPTVNWELIKNIPVNIPCDIKGNYDYDLQCKIAEKYKRLLKEKNNLILAKKRLSNLSVSVNMDKYSYTNISINELFDLTAKTNNSSFTKTFIKENPGEIPVYGASKNPEEVGYGFVQDNLPNVKYFENCLTYNIDASAGYVFYRTGKFSLSEKVRPLIIKTEYQGKLYEPYLEYVIQPIFRANIRGRRGPNGENEFTKINKTIIQDLQVPIPIKENGEFDIAVQKQIAEKNRKLQSIKNHICQEIDKVLNINIEF